jgi:hypothetical protein
VADSGDVANAVSRIGAAWRALRREQRPAAFAALALFVTMFLPWYTKTTTAIVQGRLDVVETTLIAWSAFSLVEAAVLLVAAGTLVLLFVRAEGARFHLPFGDGGVLVAAGAWVCFLVFWRTLDQPDPADAAGIRTDYGVTWGIFATFGAGVALALSGLRLRASGNDDGEAPPTRVAMPDEMPTTIAPRRRDGGEQLSFED